MGIFSSLFVKKSKALEIMHQNIATIGEKRHTISRYVISNFSNSVDPLNQLGCGLAYINEGAAYRKQAISCLEFYFANPLPLPKQPNGFPYFTQWYLHSELSTLYEKEYMFDKAIEQLELCQKYPDFTGINSADYTRIADIIVKRDGVDEAIKYIKDLKKKSVYRKIKSDVDYTYHELLEKKAKGYVYRPRKKQNT